MYIYIYLDTCVYICIYTYIYIYICLCIYIYDTTHTHTHILTTSTEPLSLGKAFRHDQTSFAPSHELSMWCRTLGQRAGEEAI